MPSSFPTDGSGQERGATERVLAEIRQALDGLRFGQVLIIVQDGVVVQIDRTEKKRLRGVNSSF